MRPTTDSPNSSETDLYIAETTRSPSTSPGSVKRRCKNPVIIPYRKYKQVPLADFMPQDEVFDDLFDDFVIRVYSNHPGFPKTDDDKHRYRKFVYHDSSTHFCRYSMSRAAFREKHVRMYLYQVHVWFEQGDWERFPGALTPKEVEALTPELKQKYIEFCEDAYECESDPDLGDIKFMPDYFRWRKKVWYEIAAGRMQRYSDDYFDQYDDDCDQCFSWRLKHFADEVEYKKD